MNHIKFTTLKGTVHKVRMSEEGSLLVLAMSLSFFTHRHNIQPGDFLNFYYVQHQMVDIYLGGTLWQNEMKTTLFIYLFYRFGPYTQRLGLTAKSGYKVEVLTLALVEFYGCFVHIR